MWKQDDFGSLMAALVWAAPFGWLWNHLAPLYLPPLPPPWRHLPFWHVEGLFLMAALLRLVLWPVPWRDRDRPWRPPARRD